MNQDDLRKEGSNRRSVKNGEKGIFNKKTEGIRRSDNKQTTGERDMRQIHFKKRERGGNRSRGEPLYSKGFTYFRHG